MLLVLVIILMLIGAAVVGTIYSNFLVFYSNFSEGENYHKAYYSAISALERGELVIKQRGPGYEGSGGFILGVGQGRNKDGHTDGLSDKSLSGFSYLGENSRPSTIFRNINARATRIPAEGQGNVERMLSAGDSENYNMMNYEDSEIFLLYYDESKDNPYKKVDCKNSSRDCTNSKPTTITGKIRLPKLLRNTRGKDLDTSNSSTKVNNESPADDPIIDRQVRGNFKLNSDFYPFTVYSSQSEAKNTVIYPDDTVIRESDINRCLLNNNTCSNPYEGIGINANGRKIFYGRNNNHGNNNPVTIISQIENDIKNNNGIYGITQLIGNDYVKEPQIRFSLLNLLKTADSVGSSGHIYPFLEYYISFNEIIPDKFYKINAEGNFADYKINLIVHKPTVKETVLGNFTSIFGR